jgi:hypothetical protein
MRVLITLLALGLAIPPSMAGDVKSSENKLKQVLASGRQKELAPAVRELAGWDSADAMKALLKLAASGPVGESYFWMEAYALMLKGCVSMTNSAAMKEASDFVIDNKAKPIARDLLAMLCNQGRPEIVPPMLAVLEKGADDMKIMAAEHLITIGDKRAIEPLIAALKSGSSSAELKKRCGQALAHITGQNFGDNASNWEGWWANNKEKEFKGPSVSDSGGGGTVALDRGRGSEWDDLKREAKVLVLGAGDKCKCGKNHDLDQIDKVCASLGLTAVFVNKVDFSKDEFKVDEYIAILANCTHIREHCACPQCKPGNYSGDRLFT